MSKPPAKLYKFKDMGDNTRKLIADRQLYLSSMTQFNDAFEFRFLTTMNKAADPSAWQKFVAASEMTDDQKKVLAKLTLEQIELVLPSVAKQFREQLERECGVFCLTEQAANLLLWAHYADSHKGICLEFDTSLEPFATDLHQAIYQDSPPVLAMPEVDMEVFANSVLRGKSLEWSYEQEWRLIREKLTGSGSRVLTYPPEALTGVILGCKFPEDKRAELDAWVALSGAKPKIYRARRSGTDYKIQLKLELEERLLNIFQGVPIGD